MCLIPLFMKLFDASGKIMFTTDVYDFSTACREAECHVLCTSFSLDKVFYDYDYSEVTGEAVWIKREWA